ncbi:MAG: nuclear transport factor 2 family protein [Bacteroidota bacterium]
MIKTKKSILVLTLIFTSFLVFSQQTNTSEEINSLLNQWHKDVANADFDLYFNKTRNAFIFIGTDANENWTKKQFQEFSKPYFDKKNTWNFTPLDRNIYFSKDKNTAWFDELLDTWMGICRGSGVLTNENGKWKIAHYVLSVTIPNEDMKKVIKIKEEKDSVLLEKFSIRTLNN